MPQLKRKGKKNVVKKKTVAAPVDIAVEFDTSDRSVAESVEDLETNQPERDKDTNQPERQRCGVQGGQSCVKEKKG